MESNESDINDERTLTPVPEINTPATSRSQSPTVETSGISASSLEMREERWTFEQGDELHLGDWGTSVVRDRTSHCSRDVNFLLSLPVTASEFASTSSSTGEEPEIQETENRSRADREIYRKICLNIVRLCRKALSCLRCIE